MSTGSEDASPAPTDASPTPTDASPAATDASIASMDAVESTTVSGDGVSLHAVTAGSPDDPLVVCLHGFPEFWYGWDAQIEPLVEAGFRVLVPDQRGYNLSEKPDGVGSYRLPTLAADVRTLVEDAGAERAHVVGHDWGGAVAWEVALRHPEVVDRLAICNAPHPTVFRRHLTSNPSQIRKSWYMLAFQLPRLPEWALRRDDFATLADAMAGRAEPGSFTGSDLEAYRAAWSRPGALSAMLGWYRAAFRYRDDPPRERVAAPTLVLWGAEDPALEPALADESAAYCRSCRVDRFPGVGHWLTHDRAEAVSARLVEHFTEDTV